VFLGRGKTATGRLRLNEQALFSLCPAATSFNRAFGEVYGLFTTLTSVSPIELIGKDFSFRSAIWAFANERT
jgi:hypothetical protein